MAYKIVNLRRTLLSFILVMTLIFLQVHGSKKGECLDPITILNGKIENEHFSASSSLDVIAYGPHKARLSGNSRWCPGKNFILQQNRPWIEVNLRKVHVLKALQIDSTFLNASRPDYQFYDFQYYRPKIDKWIHKWRVLVGDKLYNQTFNLKHPIWASKFRILPHSHSSEFPCISLELFGCLWTNGIVSYEMPVNDLGDKKYYDGKMENGVLKYGLGQLVDGKIESENSHDTMDGWLAWKNDSLAGQPVELIYEFDQLHEFDAAILVVERNKSKEAHGFSRLEIYFSNDGVHYSDKPIVYHSSQYSLQSNQNIVDLKKNSGCFVKIRLYFAARWIYASEINFKSRLIHSFRMAEKFCFGLITISALLICLLTIMLSMYYLIPTKKWLNLIHTKQRLKFSSLQIYRGSRDFRVYSDISQSREDSIYLEPVVRRLYEDDYNDEHYEPIGIPIVRIENDTT